MLTQPFPAQSLDAGASGDRLPYSSIFLAKLSFEQAFLLTQDLKGTVGGTVSYVGERQGVFVTPSSPRQSFPAYARTDVRAGLESGTWQMHLYVDNLTDRGGILTGGLGTLNSAAFIEIQPRIAGFSMEKSF